MLNWVGATCVAVECARVSKCVQVPASSVSVGPLPDVPASELPAATKTKPQPVAVGVGGGGGSSSGGGGGTKARSKEEEELAELQSWAS